MEAEELEPEDMLKELFESNMIIVNSYWFQQDWPEEAQKCIALAVLCNDVFYPCSADAEHLLYDDIKDAWSMWKKDKERGLIAWCIKSRKCRPWTEMEDYFKGSPWNIDELIRDN